MTLKMVENRVVQYPGRRKLTQVPGTTDLYDVTRAEGKVYKEGTMLDDNLNSVIASLRMQDAFEGVRVEYQWSGKKITKQLHYDSNNNIIKQVDYVWDGVRVQRETYKLNEFDDSNQLIKTTTVTVTYTWQNGVVTKTGVVVT